MENRILTTIHGMAQTMTGGDRVSKEGAQLMLMQLSKYDEQKVYDALLRCYSELKFFPSLSEIIERIADGRPSIEEAWSMCPKSEDDSAVWNEEISEAFFAARPLLLEGDAIAARMAFKEVYSRIVKENRAKQKPVKWNATFGYEKTGRVAAITNALEKKFITTTQAVHFLPELPELAPNLPAMIEYKKQNPVLIESKDDVRKLIASTMKGIE